MIADRFVVVRIHQRAQNVHQTGQALNDPRFGFQAHHQGGSQALVKSYIQRFQISSALRLKAAACPVPIHQQNDAWSIVDRTSSPVGFNEVHQDIINGPSSIEHFDWPRKAQSLKGHSVTTAFDQHHSTAFSVSSSPLG
jgi:hypothetical protein